MSEQGLIARPFGDASMYDCPHSFEPYIFDWERCKHCGWKRKKLATQVTHDDEKKND